ncbi:MAG: tRNA pseudouridine(55) synthase TruB [Oscillospiraceae bacterium]|jgi:tRNA pseudouridine55 synthase|nr:tRNA pseudouridine(55) synthase TruB [Oscillospiraceae bacterium]
MTGLLLLDKPPGLTSFFAVARVRRQLGEKKAGHTGTLDPMATGVLPILLGGATRFADYLPSHDKAYLAQFQLGIVTDTLDTTGTVIGGEPRNVSLAQLQQALAGFRGKIRQTPPMVSALKKDGVRLYALARQGVEIEREAREVEVFRLELHDERTLLVECSAGTYVRSLIDDLGRVLGCGAAMSALRRTKANGYDIAQCVTLERLETCSVQNTPAPVLPIETALASYPPVTVSEAQARRFGNGGALDLTRLRDLPAEMARFWRVLDPDGVFLGLGRPDPNASALTVERLLIR